MCIRDRILSGIESKFMPNIVDCIKADDEYIVIEDFINGETVQEIINRNGILAQNLFSEEKAVSYAIDIG